jgi:uncharacterized membrane protein (UPF0127 family)
MPSHYRLRDVASGAVVAERIRPAHTHWTRLRGLLGTAPLAPAEGLWLKPCRQVHMFGMRYAIDVVFLDDALRIVRLVGALPPWAVSPKVTAASSVLELAAGTIRRTGLTIGGQLALERSTAPATTAARSTPTPP